jgi:hypothetical protein
MERDEIRALDVPVRLFGQQRQVDAVGEARVQDADRDGFGVRAEIVAGLVVGHGCPPCWIQDRTILI